MPGMPPSSLLRIATYNIHKGVQGVGPARRLEIHNLGLAVEQLDADIVCLQEVRKLHHRGPRQFPGWPEQPQADYLAPEGYDVAYRSNAVTKEGEHGNALLSRWPIGDIGHHDVSDHRFEQRGLLHVPVTWNDTLVHAIVAHFGLIHASRVRQVQRLADFIAREVPDQEAVIVAGDFNDWGEKLDLPMTDCDLVRAIVPGDPPARFNTFPSRLPLFSMDRIYTRGFRCRSTSVPRGAAWARMSDHLPLVAELELV